MKNGKFAKRGVASKTLVMILALVLVVGCSVGGTLAWVTAQTTTVKNTFTVGDITIDLWETKDGTDNTEHVTSRDDYKIIPGTDLAKNPTVEVKPVSEPCWLFVKVEESAWPNILEDDGKTRKIDYTIADGWTKLEVGVYYRTVGDIVDKESVKYPVLADNTVTVSDTLTKEEIATINSAGFGVSFTAYAVQKENVDTAAAAWEIATK